MSKKGRPRKPMLRVPNPPEDHPLVGLALQYKLAPEIQYAMRMVRAALFYSVSDDATRRRLQGIIRNEIGLQAVEVATERLVVPHQFDGLSHLRNALSRMVVFGFPIVPKSISYRHQPYWDCPA